MNKNDDTHQTHINANDVLRILDKNPKLIGRGCLFIMMLGFLFMSGFFAIGLYFFSHHETSFLEQALETSADVINVTQQRQVDESVTGNRKTYNIRYVSIIDLRFTDQYGNIVKARLSDGENSLLRKGDVIDILYHLEDPKNVRFSKNKNNASVMRSLSYIFTIVFLALGAVAFLTTRKHKNKKAI